MKPTRREFVAGLGALPLLRVVRPCLGLGGGEPPPHAALYVYTQPLVRERHRAIAQRALERRSAAHPSGFAEHDGKPLLAIGPVPKDAAYWHGAEKVKDVPRAWPFVAVLEYAGEGKPLAYVDWFRRAADARAADGWLADPGVDYAGHHNAQLVTGQDDRWCYLAVPDAPTGDYVGGAQFALRARVAWADGRRVQKGWWLHFDAPAGKPASAWSAAATPLVDWRVTQSKPSRGAVDVAPVDDPDRELAVLGTEEVFRFPPVPAGVTPGRGRG
jgi:hypothetical protein